MKYPEKINSNPLTFIVLVAVQAYGHHQPKTKDRKAWVSFKNGPRTAAFAAVGKKKNKGKLKGQTNAERKPGILPHDVMVLSKYKAKHASVGSQGSVVSHVYLG